MDFHLERAIRLSTESEYKSLYEWSLQEWSRDGEMIGRNQVPWHWTLRFSAAELRHVISLESRGSALSGECESIKKIDQREWIQASLMPDQDRRTAYSMFGTGRPIRDFSLQIFSLPDGESEETCSVWGGVSFTSEIDFRDETQPDALEISLHVSSDRFAQLVQGIRDSNASRLTISLGGVSGFYSEWSPSISTSSIKVLTSDSEHSVEVPDGCSIEPPRLGAVGSFALTLVSARSLTAPAGVDETGEDSRLDFEQVPAERSSEIVWHASLAELQRLNKSVGAVQKVLWILAALLAYLALR